MKINSTHDTRRDAVEELLSQGFSPWVLQSDRQIWCHPTTYEFRLLKQWHGRWEIQTPEVLHI
jgi:hypothetical protein